MSVSPISFQGTYKVTLPNVKEAKTENEKKAYIDTAINTAALVTNACIEKPRISPNEKSLYFKIDDKNDEKFEKAFSQILENSNKQFNIDMAKKAYLQKASEEEYKKGILA